LQATAVILLSCWTGHDIRSGVFERIRISTLHLADGVDSILLVYY